MSGGANNLSGGGNSQCYASCPASTVTIQPPPFVLNIPGPALYCPDQPFRIEQHNPCAGSGYGGGNPALSGGSGGGGGTYFSNFYSRALPSSNYCYSTYRY